MFLRYPWKRRFKCKFLETWRDTVLPTVSNLWLYLLSLALFSNFPKLPKYSAHLYATCLKFLSRFTHRFYSHPHRQGRREPRKSTLSAQGWGWLQEGLAMRVKCSFAMVEAKQSTSYPQLLTLLETVIAKRVLHGTCKWGWLCLAYLPSCMGPHLEVLTPLSFSNATYLPTTFFVLSQYAFFTLPWASPQMAFYFAWSIYLQIQGNLFHVWSSVFLPPTNSISHSTVSSFTLSIQLKKGQFEDEENVATILEHAFRDNRMFWENKESEERKG
jgi:hypothetical protein